MPSVHVLTDTPTEVILSAGKATSQVQIAKTGKFKDPRYGNFTISLADFSKWIANFNTLHRGEGRLGLPVDVDHNPEKKGDTEAAGWITALSIKNNELWATVEWNDLGQELVGNRRYAYLSPSYVHDYKDEQGKSHGTALVGVGLTNRPFLTMATVSLSAASFAEELPYNPERMPDFKNIAVKLGLAEDADEATILAKLAEQSTPVTLEAQASAEGKIVLDANKYAELAQNASEGAAAAKTLKQMRFDNAFDKALSEGRAVPAMKDDLASMYEAAPDAAIKLLDGLQQVVNMTPQGSGQAPQGQTLSTEVKRAAEGLDVDDDRNKLHNRALQLMAEAGNDDYGAALDRAMQE